MGKKDVSKKESAFIVAGILVFVSLIAFWMAFANLSNPWDWIVFVVALILLFRGLAALIEGIKTK